MTKTGHGYDESNVKTVHWKLCCTALRECWLLAEARDLSFSKDVDLG